MNKAVEYITKVDTEVSNIIDAYNNIVKIGKCAVNDLEMSLGQTGAVLDRIRLVEISDYSKSLRDKIYD